MVTQTWITTEISIETSDTSDNWLVVRPKGSGGEGA
jgi:hypothetical protein